MTKNIQEPVIQLKLEQGTVFSFGRRYWKVLEIDDTAHTLLVQSRFSIGIHAYHEKYCEITWETCSLRKWLNTVFLQEEFNEQEQQGIAVSHVETNDHAEFRTEGGNDTYDQIFILSEEEEQKYRTDYAISDDSEEFLSLLSWDNGYTSIRTRSPGSTAKTTLVLSMAISELYTVEERDVDNKEAVYPAFRLNMNSEIVRSLLSVNDAGECMIRSKAFLLEHGTVKAAHPELTEIELPAEVRKIGSNAFRKCEKLKTVTWSGSMPEIADNAFSDCPNLNLPESYYLETWKPAYWASQYMPLTPRLLALCLVSKEDGYNESYYHHIRYHLNEENACAVADCILEYFQTSDKITQRIALLRFTLAAAPVLGKERLQKLSEILYRLYPSDAGVKKHLEREIRLCEQPHEERIETGLLDWNLISETIIEKYWEELDHLPMFAALMRAVIPYYSDENLEPNHSLEGVRPLNKRKYDAGWYTDLRNRRIKPYRIQSDNNALIKDIDPAYLTRLLKRWAKADGEIWYIPYAVIANDRQLDALLKAMKKWKSRVHQLGYESQIYGAVLLNDTVTAMRFAEVSGLLTEYAELHDMDAEDIRDHIICSFGLDTYGKRSWTLAGKILTASLNKDLSITLADANGTVYTSMPKIGMAAQNAKAAREYRDLQKNILPSADSRNGILFDAFLSGAQKEAEKWKNAYLYNPVLRLLAEKIVWSQNDSTFILDETGKPVTADGIPYTMTDAPVKVAHPMEMGKAVTEAWQRYVTKHHLKQPFDQVWEPVEDPARVTGDRYASHFLPTHLFWGKKRHGFTLEDDWLVMKDCRADIQMFDNEYIEWIQGYDIRSFTYDIWNRQVNHIVTYLNKHIITVLIENDEMSAAEWLDCFTLKQVTEFIDIATEAKAYHVLAKLLDYKNSLSGTVDPMGEFTWDPQE